MHPSAPWKPRVPSAVRRALAGAIAVLLATSGPAAAFDLQGHRGARGLAPENTLAGFRTALALGVTTLELDTGVTRDGVVVIAHDPELNPAIARDPQGAWINAPGPPLRSLTFAELQAYDVGRLRPGTRYAHAFPSQRPADGERVPALAALFDQVARWGATEVRFNVETKLTPDSGAQALEPEAFARAVIDVVRRHGLESRVTLQSFDWRTLKAARSIAPSIDLAALTVQSDRFDNVRDGRWTAGLKLADHGGSVPRLVQAIGARVWSPNLDDLSEPLVREAQALKLKVVPWTVNDPAAIERLLDWGVDGIISDYPDRVRAAMQRRGMPLPPAAAGAR
jgi:glycerophosphoryl diester phosphodiesterase